MRLFLDTNVLFDYISGRTPHFSNAQNLMIMKTFGDVELSVAGKSYTDIFYTMKKEQSVYEIQDSILDSLKIFDVCSLERDDIEAACKLGWPDFEDALIEISAQKVGADYLITRDAEFGYVRTKARTPVCTPEEIIAIFDKRGLTYAAIDLDRLCLD